MTTMLERPGPIPRWARRPVPVFDHPIGISPAPQGRHRRVPTKEEMYRRAAEKWLEIRHKVQEEVTDLIRPYALAEFHMA